MEKSVWRANFRRALGAPNLYLAIVLTAVMLLLTSFDSRRHAWFDVLEAYNTSLTSGSWAVFLCILPAVPFAMNYAADRNTGMVDFWTVRTGTRRYALSQYLMSVLLGFCSVFFGLMLFAVILRLSGKPFFRVISAGGSYAIFLKQKQPLLFFLLKTCHTALSGAIMAGVGAWVGSLVPNRLTVMAAPLVLYVLAVRLTGSSLPGYLQATLIIGGVYEVSRNWIATLLVKLAATCILCAVLGAATVFNVRRRQLNA